MRSFILPLLGYIGYPMAVAGGILVFAASSLLTFDMIRANLVAVSSPIAASPDFNVPPVEQIGSLAPPVTSTPSATPSAEPESSIVAVVPPDHPVATTVSAPETPTFMDVEPPGLASRRIGRQAVNVRAGPSNTAVTLGVLNAGSSVRVDEEHGGWLHVYFAGGDGWVYQSFVE